MYKDGQMLGSAEHTHGWGFNGGKAVAVNDKYVYIALAGENEGGNLVDEKTRPLPYCIAYFFDKFTDY